ncbi:hypothetical protein BaRGS_00021904 [Batillaria attramentaria]|uniref:Uncharacterized protein n=1 Tax=Batillaria attramentaria TaxID=370345 RepID=A0ABD0KIW2_9CAEN
MDKETEGVIMSSGTSARKTHVKQICGSRQAFEVTEVVVRDVFKMRFTTGRHHGDTRESRFARALAGKLAPKDGLVRLVRLILVLLLQDSIVSP